VIWILTELLILPIPLGGGNGEAGGNRKRRSRDSNSYFSNKIIRQIIRTIYQEKFSRIPALTCYRASTI